MRNNLAVGSTSASANLDIVGNARISGNLNVDSGTFWVDATNNRIGINNTNPLQAFDVKGSANISVDTFVRNNLAIGTTTATANLTVTGNARISSNVIIGPNNPFNLQNGTALVVYNASQIDSNINGSISGNVYHQLAMGGRNWVFSQDVSNDSILYFGSQGGGDPDPDFDYYFKRSVGLQIQPSPSIITTDFNSALSVLGNAVITGNLNVDSGTFWVDATNNRVGILNTNPAYTMDVSGNINFTGNLYQNGNIFTSGGGSSQWTTSGSNIYYNVANGNVGIGTTTPYYKLDIGGSANIGANLYCMNMFVINDCLVQGGDFSIMNGNLTVYKRFNTFGESVLNGNLTVYNADLYNYGNTYIYNGLYVNKNGALYTNNDVAGQHAFYSYDTVNLMSTLYGGADDTNKVGYFQARGYGGGLPLLLNPNGGNVGVGTGTPRATLSVSGNAVITGNVNINNGNIFMNRFGNLGIGTTNPLLPLHVIGDANISGSMYSSTGYIPLCRASISFRYASTTLTTIYSNNCSVARNGVGSYTITFINGPGSTNYTVSTFSAGAVASTITQVWVNSGQVSVVALKSNTQCLIWISDNSSDAANEPIGMCDVNFFW